jgi:hypothetical protein
MNEFPLFMQAVQGKNVKFTDSELNVAVMFDNLVHISEVASMRKRVKYQHLLKNVYNGNMFSLRKYQDKDEQQHQELVTLTLLMCFLDYIKGEYGLEAQPYKKTNLEVWALFPLLDYIAQRVSDETRSQDSVFSEPYMKDIIVNRIYCISKELQRAKSCVPDIKYRVAKVLGYLAYKFQVPID